MVRLLRLNFAAVCVIMMQFQSHNDAIAADCQPALNLLIHPRFNPTMVRLLRRLLVDQHWQAVEFQSHNGAIAAEFY